MKVKTEYKNKKLEVVASREVPLDVYCVEMSNDLIDLLSEIEAAFYKYHIKYKLDTDYRKIRHRIFDLAGAIERLPNNIM